MCSDLNDSIKNMDDNDLFINLATKSHILLFLTNLKEVKAVTNEINVIKTEIRDRGQKIGDSKEPERRQY